MRIEPWLARSWQRCLAAGLRPQQRVVFDAVSAPRRCAGATERSARLLRAARPVLDQLSRAIVDTRYFAILTDADGVVIDIGAQPDRADRHAGAIARIGIDLSERMVGTTAIGAALAEQTSVWLHRGEHFFDDTSIYTCAGAPLADPLGRCIGMLDLTGVNVVERPALRHLAQHSAHAIENALVRAQPCELLLQFNWPGCLAPDETDGSDGLLCVGADGEVVGANAAARQLLPAAHAGWRRAGAVRRPVRGADADAVRCRAAPSGRHRSAAMVGPAAACAGLAQPAQGGCRRRARRAGRAAPGCAMWRRP